VLKHLHAACLVPRAHSSVTSVLACSEADHFTFTALHFTVLVTPLCMSNRQRYEGSAEVFTSVLDACAAELPSAGLRAAAQQQY
jgi:hypothetical protein